MAANVATPKGAAIVERASGLGSTTAKALDALPRATSPPISARAMLPPPMKVMFKVSFPIGPVEISAVSSSDQCQSELPDHGAQTARCRYATASRLRQWQVRNPTTFPSIACRAQALRGARYRTARAVGETELAPGHRCRPLARYP